MQRTLKPNLWTAKLNDAYRVTYRRQGDGTPYLLYCGYHDAVYRRAEKLWKSGGCCRGRRLHSRSVTTPSSDGKASSWQQ